MVVAGVSIPWSPGRRSKLASSTITDSGYPGRTRLFWGGVSVIDPVMCARLARCKVYSNGGQPHKLSQKGQFRDFNDTPRDRRGSRQTTCGKDCASQCRFVRPVSARRRTDQTCRCNTGYVRLPHRARSHGECFRPVKSWRTRCLASPTRPNLHRGTPGPGGQCCRSCIHSPSQPVALLAWVSYKFWRIALQLLAAITHRSVIGPAEKHRSATLPGRDRMRIFRPGSFQQGVQAKIGRKSRNLASSASSSVRRGGAGFRRDQQPTGIHCRGGRGSAGIPAIFRAFLAATNRPHATARNRQVVGPGSRG